MIKYFVEEGSGSYNLFLEDQEEGVKKRLIAVIFDQTHAKIITRQMNEYVNERSY